MATQAKSNKINSFSPLRESQERVRALLKRGKYDDASLTSYGRLGEFVEFLHQFGIFSIFSEMGTENKPMGVSHYLLTMTWLMRAVLGFKAIDNLKYMFQDPHVMRLIGFNAKQVQEGYSKRTRNPGAHKPIHPHTVRNFGKSLAEGKAEIFNSDIIKELRRRGLIKKGVFAMDSKYIIRDGKKVRGSSRG